MKKNKTWVMALACAALAFGLLAGCSGSGEGGDPLTDAPVDGQPMDPGMVAPEAPETPEAPEASDTTTEPESDMGTEAPEDEAALPEDDAAAPEDDAAVPEAPAE